MLRGYLRAGVLLRERWILCFGRRGFCGSTEPPELPDWFKSADSGGNSEEDFELPSEPELPGDRKNGSPALGNGVFHRILPPHPGKNADADAVSSVLRASFASPEAVVQALHDCAANVPEELVDQILRRFSNDWISAFGFFNWADSQAGYTHSRELYDKMVDILGKAKQFQRMWSLVNEMVQVGQLVTLTTMSKVMRRLAKGHRWPEAVEVFRCIHRFGVEKDTAAMNIILDSLCKECAVRRAWDLFMEVRDEISPDASSFNSLIHGWCQARRFNEARLTMDEMRRFGFKPCVISYTSFIEAHCLDMNFGEAYLVLNEMEANGCHPNIITYTILMHSHGKAGKIHEAMLVYDRMKSSSCVPDVLFYNSLIYILASSGHLHDAYDVYREMKRNHIKPNTKTYNTLIAAACRCSEEERALKLLHEMEESSCVPDIMTFTPLLKMKCTSKSTEVLQSLLDYMLKMDVTLDLGTYSLLVTRLCRSGRLVEACSYFREMVMKGFLPRNSTYVMLMEELERQKLEEGKQKIRMLMARAHRTGG